MSSISQYVNQNLVFWCGVRFQDGGFVVVSVLIHCEDTERDFRDLRTGWGLGYFTEH